MSLKITLKPGERLFIGGAVLRNGPARSQIFIENKVRVLREKEILLEQECDTVAKRIYFLIQAMYMEGPKDEYNKAVGRLMDEFVGAAPSAFHIAMEITKHVLANNLYLALKASRKLIAFEKERLEQFAEQFGGPDVDVEAALRKAMAEEATPDGSA